MTQRLASAATIALIAFMVVLLGALATYVALKGPTSTSALAAQQAAASTSTAPVQAPDQSQSPQEQQPAGSGASNGYPVSWGQAANIALGTVPGSSLLQQPRLVNVNGTVAYEVPLDQGMVYVNATGGQVLFNSANGQQARPRRWHR
jgi:uncharacterized membrane protein YkoI